MALSQGMWDVLREVLSQHKSGRIAFKNKAASHTQKSSTST